MIFVLACCTPASLTSRMLKVKRLTPALHTIAIFSPVFRDETLSLRRLKSDSWRALDHFCSKFDAASMQQQQLRNSPGEQLLPAT